MPIILTGLLAACQVFSGPDVVSTLQSNNRSMATEAVALEQTGQAEETQLLVTVQAYETEIAQIMVLNQHLVSTVRAGDRPTEARAPGVVPDAAQFVATGTGNLQFVQTGTANQVRESDGCAVAVQTQFTPDTPRIYVTTRALNIAEGTVVQVEWRYEGTMQFQESWAVPYSASEFCLWFHIEPDSVALVPGSWSARLFVENSGVEAEATFLIVEAMTDGQ